MIKHTLSGATARLVLDRPASRNALDLEAWRDLAQAADVIAASSARVLVVASAAQGAFCAGSDLRNMAELAAGRQAAAEFRAVMRAALDGLHGLPIPTIAMIDGDCFGAGVAVALACDIRIAGPAARFAITPAKLGISYPQVDVARLVSAVGRGQAARLLFTAASTDPIEAARIGLVEVAVDDAEATAAQWAAAIARNSATSVRALKPMLHSEGYDAAFDRSFDGCFEGPDLHEGLAAFREKRPPDFG